MNWTTATEINNYSFEIERRGEGIWEKIGFVAGKGNSTSRQDYFFTDENTKGGTKFFYRLKQIDSIGSSSYSNQVEAIIIPQRYELLQNYPNPFNPLTEISITLPDRTEVTLKVYDILGKEVETLLEGHFNPGFYKVHFDGSDLSSGLYYYELKTSDFSSVKKMVLIK